MTTFYGSKRQPAQALKDNPIASVEDFYQILYEHLEGAMVCMEVMQNCWQSKSLVHEWTLPDGHVAHVRVMDTVNKKVEIDELNHATFTYRCEVNTPLPTGLSLAANIIHSIDGYIVREMYRLAERQRFELLSIHDSFWASPEYMNNVRDNYRDIMISIYESDLLQHILREITGLNGVIPKGDTTMAKDMQRSVYMLS